MGWMNVRTDGWMVGKMYGLVVNKLRNVKE